MIPTAACKFLLPSPSPGYSCSCSAVKKIGSKCVLVSLSLVLFHSIRLECFSKSVIGSLIATQVNEKAITVKIKVLLRNWGHCAYHMTLGRKLVAPWSHPCDMKRVQVEDQVRNPAKCHQQDRSYTP